MRRIPTLAAFVVLASVNGVANAQAPTQVNDATPMPVTVVDEGARVDQAEQTTSATIEAPVATPPESGVAAAVADAAMEVPAMPEPPPRRENPFLPRLTTDEQKVLDVSEKRERDLRDFKQTLRSELIPSIMDEVRRELKDEIARQAPKPEGVAGGLESAMAGVAGEGGSLVTPASGPVAKLGADGKPIDPLLLLNGRPPELPEATFVSCVNGKALYRDSKTTILFERPEDTTTCD